MLTETIRREAQRREIGPRELALKIGCSPAQMSRFLNGKSNLSAPRLDKLAALLNFRIET